MNVNYSLEGLKPELNYLTAGLFDRVKAVGEMKEGAKRSLTAQFTDLRAFEAVLSDIKNLCFKNFPAESITKRQDMDSWWDHIAGGWSPDKLASVR